MTHGIGTKPGTNNFINSKVSGHLFASSECDTISKAAYKSIVYETAVLLFPMEEKTASVTLRELSSSNGQVCKLTAKENSFDWR